MRAKSLQETVFFPPKKYPQCHVIVHNLSLFSSILPGTSEVRIPQSPVLSYSISIFFPQPPLISCIPHSTRVFGTEKERGLMGRLTLSVWHRPSATKVLLQGNLFICSRTWTSISTLTAPSHVRKATLGDLK